MILDAGLEEPGDYVLAVDGPAGELAEAGDGVAEVLDHRGRRDVHVRGDFLVSESGAHHKEALLLPPGQMRQDPPAERVRVLAPAAVRRYLDAAALGVHVDVHVAIDGSEQAPRHAHLGLVSAVESGQPVVFIDERGNGLGHRVPGSSRQVEVVLVDVSAVDGLQLVPALADELQGLAPVIQRQLERFLNFVHITEFKNITASENKGRYYGFPRRTVNLRPGLA